MLDFESQGCMLWASQVALVVKNPPATAGDIREMGLIPWFGKIPWRRVWQPIPVPLPGESPWTEGLGGCHSIGPQRVRCDWSDLAGTCNTETHVLTFFHMFSNVFSFPKTVVSFDVITGFRSSVPFSSLEIVGVFVWHIMINIYRPGGQKCFKVDSTHMYRARTVHL